MVKGLSFGLFSLFTPDNNDDDDGLSEDNENVFVSTKNRPSLGVKLVISSLTIGPPETPTFLLSIWLVELELGPSNDEEDVILLLLLLLLTPPLWFDEEEEEDPVVVSAPIDSKRRMSYWAGDTSGLNSVLQG